MLPSLAVVDDAALDEHRPPSEHPERPERLLAARRAVAALEGKASIRRVLARPASDDELARVHTPAYIDLLGRSAGKWSYFDADTYLAPASAGAARLAAGGAIELVNTLLDGTIAHGVALLRPPGHHARPSGAMGFCLLNNVAIAAAHARARGAERVLIIDFDVHHGNGTQEAFYADPSVTFVSLHQFPFYPGSGDVPENGAGDGRGFTVNVPLSAGADDAAYAAAFGRIVAPVASELAPSLVLLSAGFDAHVADPLAQMRLSAGGYGSLMHVLKGSLAAGTPVGMVLEGGYDLDALQASLTASLDALLGGSPPPPPGSLRADTRHGLELDRALTGARGFWHL